MELFKNMFRRAVEEEEKKEVEEKREKFTTIHLGRGMWSWYFRNAPGWWSEEKDKYEELALREDVSTLEEKIDLVLKHLNVEYVAKEEVGPRLRMKKAKKK